MDRITTAISPWISATTILVGWLTLHKEDHVFQTIASETLRTEFARIHKLLDLYTQKELRKIKGEDE